MTATAHRRDLSLDSFRGIDVLLMILVNVQGSYQASYATLRHAEWHGFTLADAVFPVFLLIVGLSAPLALDRDDRRVDWLAIVRRTLLLFLIGVVLGWLIWPTLDPELIRWTGVLQRIAIVYLVCAAVLLVRRGVLLPALLAALLLALHSWLLLRAGSPAGGPPGLEPGMGISGWLDRQFIPGRVLRGSWDPEGVLSTVPAIATGLIGVAVMRWIRRRDGASAKLAVAGVLLLLSGLGLAPVIPINKNLWTASFALVACGAGLIFWAMLRAVWSRIGDSRVMRGTVSLGQAALTLYIVHMLLIAVLVRTLPEGGTIWEASFALIAGIGLPPALASLLYALLAVALCCAVMPVLQRRGWVLKV